MLFSIGSEPKPRAYDEKWYLTLGECFKNIFLGYIPKNDIFGALWKFQISQTKSLKSIKI